MNLHLFTVLKVSEKYKQLWQLPRKAFVFLRDINTSVMILASQAKDKMKFLATLGKPKRYFPLIGWLRYISVNRPFPSSLLPLFQSESKCETIVMKMSLICMKMKLHAELIFVWKVSHFDSFKTEAQENPEMAYSLVLSRCETSLLNNR